MVLVSNKDITGCVYDRRIENGPSSACRLHPMHIEKCILLLEFHSSNHGASILFLCVDNPSQQMLFIVHTKSLFRELSTLGTKFFSLIANKIITYISLLEESYHRDEIVRHIDFRFDPENLFASDETCNNFFLVVPNIRDGDGFLNTPDEYKQKLRENLDKSFVGVNVALKCMLAPFSSFHRYHFDFDIVVNQGG